MEVNEPVVAYRTRNVRKHDVLDRKNDYPEAERVFTEETEAAFRETIEHPERQTPYNGHDLMAYAI
jgi:hypothetical protein